MSAQSRPRRAYPFTLGQVTGKTPPPALSDEEARQQWDAVEATDPSPEEEDGWGDTFASLYDEDLSQTYAARARYLQANGDEPEALREMCQMPRQLRLLRDPEGMEAEEVEEHAAFVGEVAVYFAYWENRVMERRNRYVVRLRELGWTQPQIASLLGLTKQRVHAILESAGPAQGEGERGASARTTPLVSLAGLVEKVREADQGSRLTGTLQSAHHRRGVGRGMKRDHGGGGASR